MSLNTEEYTGLSDKEKLSIHLEDRRMLLKAQSELFISDIAKNHCVSEAVVIRAIEEFFQHIEYAKQFSKS